MYRPYLDETTEKYHRLRLACVCNPPAYRPRLCVRFTSSLKLLQTFHIFLNFSICLPAQDTFFFCDGSSNKINTFACDVLRDHSRDYSAHSPSWAVFFSVKEPSKLIEEFSKKHLSEVSGDEFLWGHFFNGSICFLRWRLRWFWQQSFP